MNVIVGGKQEGWSHLEYIWSQDLLGHGETWGWTTTTQMTITTIVSTAIVQSMQKRLSHLECILITGHAWLTVRPGVKWQTSTSSTTVAPHSPPPPAILYDSSLSPHHHSTTTSPLSSSSYYPHHREPPPPPAPSPTRALPTLYQFCRKSIVYHTCQNFCTDVTIFNWWPEVSGRRGWNGSRSVPVVERWSSIHAYI